MSKNKMPSQRRAVRALSDSLSCLDRDPDVLKLVQDKKQSLHDATDNHEKDRLATELAELETKGHIIRNRVVAQLGVFKDSRGEFSLKSLEKIVELGNAQSRGLRGHIKHATMSDDGVGKHLGRDRNFWLDVSDPEMAKVRSDCHISPMAMKSPPEGGGTPWGEYVMGLVSSDPGALSSSLVLQYKPEHYYGEDGERERTPDGELKPAVWIPTVLRAIDVVDTGAAVDDFLSLDSLSENDRFVREGAELISQYFDLDEISREALDARLSSFKDNLLNFHYSESCMSTKDQTTDHNTPDAELEKLKLKNANLEKELELAKLSGTNSQADADKSDSTAKDVVKIAALCKAQGKEDLTVDFQQQYIDGALSVDGVKDQLLKLNADQRSMDDSTNTGDQGVEGKKQDLDAKLREEYLEDIEVHEMTGLSEEAFIKDRKIELGKATETSPLLSKVKTITSISMVVVGALLTAAAAFTFLPAEVAISALSLVGVGMAVTANQLTGYSSPHLRRKCGIAATINIYDGACSFYDAGGDATNIIASGANQFLGFACNQYDNSSGADGDISGEFIGSGQVTPKNASHSFTDADLGKLIYATDNFSFTTTSTSNTLVGTLIELDENSDPVIDLDKRA